MSKSSNVPVAVMLLFIAVVQLLALAVTPAISASGDRVFEDPASTVNPFIYVILILGFTAILLLAMRLKKGWLVGGFIQLSIAASIYYVLAAFLPPLLALLPTLAVMLLLRYYPEWYVIDAFGIVVCAGISALFGVSMDPLPALVLLVILAVYDAISVYKTRHMVSLAEGVIKMKAPLLFVVPKSRDYSFRKEHFAGSGGDSGSGQSTGSGSDAVSTDSSKDSSKDKGRRGAFFLGLGDAIIPTILVISAYVAFPGSGIFGVGYPAAGAMLGTYLGFLLLMTTSRDRPQAGLPFLNSGVILGFLAGCLAAGIRPF
ncbi:MAG TPA: presenilin family intramembrane aspartyl protease PSH [Methanothrix sp.]|nr:presenilin family intramembrane aspartyl protease PSH [Methanothrix sp.]HPT19564.1 presenilin family intramembrane aspartyl protease PSH [Methanothrix sp.]